MPIIPRVHVIMFMWLVTNMDAEMNISFSDTWQLGSLAPTITLEQASYFVKSSRNETKVFGAALFLRPQDCNSFRRCS